MMFYKNHNYWFFYCALFVLVLLAPFRASASLTLEWTANSGVAGYHLYTGTASGVYTVMADEGLATSAAAPNLQAGTKYYFVLTAYASDGSESAPSTEVSYTVPSGPGLSASSTTVLMLNGSAVSVNLPSGGSVSQVTQPKYGSAVINSGNLVTYTANGTYPGHDSFVYTVSAPGEASASGTVYVSSQGSFSGLVSNSSPESINTGLLQLTVGNGARFTGRLTMGALVTPISGAFDRNGNATVVLSWEGIPVVELNLTLSAATGQVSGSMTVSSSPTASTVSATMLTYSTANKAPQAGAYTLLMPPATSSTTGAAPQGVGYFRLVVGTNGSATLTGKLADNTALSASGWVAPDGTLNLYRPLYGSKGFISGQLKFESITDAGVQSDLDGTLTWQRPAVTTGVNYPAGFSTSISAIGSTYTTSTNSIAALLPGGQKKALVSLAGSALSAPVADQVSLVGPNTLKESTTGGTQLVVQLSPGTGLFTGRFIDPATGRISLIGGAVFQKRALGAGSFFLSAQSGSVLVQNSGSGSE
jgi:hypothetical protein